MEALIWIAAAVVVFAVVMLIIKRINDDRPDYLDDDFWRGPF